MREKSGLVIELKNPLNCEEVTAERWVWLTPKLEGTTQVHYYRKGYSCNTIVV